MRAMTESCSCNEADCQAQHGRVAQTYAAQDYAAQAVQAANGQAAQAVQTANVQAAQAGQAAPAGQGQYAQAGQGQYAQAAQGQYAQAGQGQYAQAAQAPYAQVLPGGAPPQAELTSGDAPGPRPKRVPAAREIAGLIVSGLGFSISMVSTSASWDNGELSRFSYSDSAAKIAGLVALALGVASLLALSRTHRTRKIHRLVLAVIILGFGGLHIARGMGAFAEPPSYSSSSMRIGDYSYGRDRGVRAPAPRGVVAPAPRAAPTVSEAEFLRLGAECLDGSSCDEFSTVGLPACEREPLYCARVAFLIHYLGATGDVDIDAARAGFRRGCELGEDPHACEFLSLLITHLAEAQRFPPPIYPLIATACERGNVLACTKLAWILDSGAGGVKDLARSQRLAQRACDAKSGSACQLRGTAIYESKENLAQARSLFKRGCELEDTGSCVNLAIMMKRAEGGAQDIAGAKTVSERACDYGHLESCQAYRFPSRWINHPSHSRAKLLRIEVGVTGQTEERLDSDDQSVELSVRLTKDSRNAKVTVYSKGPVIEVGSSFPRHASVEAFLNGKELFVLVHETTLAGKITSTKGFRYRLQEGSIIPAGSFEGEGRVSWRTATPI